MTVRIDSLLFLIMGVISICLLTLACSVLLLLFHYLFDQIYSMICKRWGYEFRYSCPEFYDLIYSSLRSAAVGTVLFFFVYWYLHLREAGVIFQ